MDTKYFDIGGFTIKINSELPFRTDTFHEKLKPFEAAGTGQDNIVITHHFAEKIRASEPAENRIYYRKPWAVFRKGNGFVYEWFQDDSVQGICRRKVVTNTEHTIIDTYNDAGLAETFAKGGLTEISLLPTDQIFLSRALAYRQGCIMHSMGLVHKGRGYVFVGHSGAGKSTAAKIMHNDATILCDDRNIIRKISKTHILYGTWRHSDFNLISPLSAPVSDIFFLNKSNVNRLHYIKNHKTRFQKLLSCLVKPLVSGGWWDLSFDILSNIAGSIDCWDMEFDKTGKIKDHIMNLHNKDKSWHGNRK
jgi:hypothetical protein